MAFAFISKFIEVQFNFFYCTVYCLMLLLFV